MLFTVTTDYIFHTALSGRREERQTRKQSRPYLSAMVRHDHSSFCFEPKLKFKAKSDEAAKFSSIEMKWNT